MNPFNDILVLGEVVEETKGSAGFNKTDDGDSGLCRSAVTPCA